MKIYEVTLPGFDASSDDTDHLVLWVQAPDPAAVERAVPGGKVSGLIMDTKVMNASDVDGSLPRDEAWLRKVASIAKTEATNRGAIEIVKALASVYDDTGDDVHLVVERVPSSLLVRASLRSPTLNGSLTPLFDPVEGEKELAALGATAAEALDNLGAKLRTFTGPG